MAACPLQKCPQIITLWDRVGESSHHFAAGEGGRRHKFLTSLAGWQCCCRCFSGHCCCCYLTITAKTWPTQKTAPGSLVIDSLSGEHQDGMFVFSSTTKKDLTRRLQEGASILSFDGTHGPPQPHVLVSTNSDQSQSRKTLTTALLVGKLLCYQFPLTKIYALVHIFFVHTEWVKV